MIIPISELSKRTNVSEKAILKLLADVRFSVNIERSMKNDRVTGVDIGAFIRNLKGKHFKTTYGYAQPNEFPAIIKERFSTVKISDDAVLSVLGNLAKNPSVEMLDVSLNAEGPRYRMFKVESTLVLLKPYIAERTAGAQATTTKTVKAPKVQDDGRLLAVEAALAKAQAEIVELKRKSEIEVGALRQQLFTQSPETSIEDMIETLVQAADKVPSYHIKDTEFVAFLKKRPRYLSSNQEMLLKKLINKYVKVQN